MFTEMLLMLFFIMTIVSMLKDYNPINMSLKIMLICLYLCIILWFNSSTSLLSILILMLFIGGVFTIFMIISSLYPSLPIFSHKINFLMYFCVILLIVSNYKSIYMNLNTMMLMKIFMNLKMVILMLSAMILSYFITSFLILCTEKQSMKFNF